MIKINKEKKNSKHTVLVATDSKRERLLAKMLKKKKDMLTEKVLTFSWKPITVNYKKKALRKPIFNYMDFVSFHYSSALDNIFLFLCKAVEYSPSFMGISPTRLNSFVKRAKTVLLFSCTWILALNLRKSENYLQFIWIKKVIKAFIRYSTMILLMNMVYFVAQPLYVLNDLVGLMRWKSALNHTRKNIKKGNLFYYLYFDYFLLSSDLWHNKNRLTPKTDPLFDLNLNPVLLLKPYTLNLSKHEGEDTDEQPDENLTSLRHVSLKFFLVLHTSMETHWSKYE